MTSHISHIYHIITLSHTSDLKILNSKLSKSKAAAGHLHSCEDLIRLLLHLGINFNFNLRDFCLLRKLKETFYGISFRLNSYVVEYWRYEIWDKEVDDFENSSWNENHATRDEFSHPDEEVESGGNKIFPEICPHLRY